MCVCVRSLLMACFARTHVCIRALCTSAFVYACMCVCMGRMPTNRNKGRCVNAIATPISHL